MMVPIQVIRWYRMQCYDGTDSCAIVVPIRRYCHIINRDYVFKVNPGLQRIILSNSRLEKDILIKASKDALKNLKEKLETEEELTLEKEGGNS